MIFFKTINKFEMCIYEKGRVYASDIFYESTAIVFLNVKNLSNL